MRHTLRTALALGLGTLSMGLATGAIAGPASFNGTWQVRMVTEAGSCDRSYTYTLAVEDGQVRYDQASADEAPVRVSGKVGEDGRVTLGIRRSLASAAASGKLQGNGGTGAWKVEFLGCSGRWTAERRTTTASAER
jgi:hypothetical protein